LANGHYTEIRECTDGEIEPHVRTWDAGKDWKEKQCCQLKVSLGRVSGKRGSRIFHLIFAFAVWRAKEAQSVCEVLDIIAGNLSRTGWSWGCVSGVDVNGRRIFVAGPHRRDGNRFVAQAGEKLTAICGTR
jgi:hypothetical protein